MCPEVPRLALVPETVGVSRGDFPSPWCSLVFHSRVLALHGAECAYSSHTALSLNTGGLFP